MPLIFKSLSLQHRITALTDQCQCLIYDTSNNRQTALSNVALDYAQFLKRFNTNNKTSIDTLQQPFNRLFNQLVNLLICLKAEDVKTSTGKKTVLNLMSNAIECLSYITDNSHCQNHCQGLLTAWGESPAIRIVTDRNIHYTNPRFFTQTTNNYWNFQYQLKRLNISQQPIKNISLTTGFE